MTTITLQAIGFAWFQTAEDFAWARREFISDTSCRRPSRSGSARLAVPERLRVNGQVVERVTIDPATFPAWCRETASS
jgi:hypothetical protein